MKGFLIYNRLMKEGYVNSTYKTLLLLDFLYKNEMSKNDIIEAFKKNNITIAKSSINNYLEKLSKCGFEIEKKVQNSAVIYCLNKSPSLIELNKTETDTLQKVKKLMLLEKNYNFIRVLMRVFFKFARYIESDEIKANLLDFGYYSKINWALVKQLEQHCIDNNKIEIDYILPDGSNKFIEIHADSLSIGNSSKRLYLNGKFKDAKRLSSIPVDRIFMVKSVLRKNARFHLYLKPLVFIVSKNSYENNKQNAKCTLMNEKDGYVILKIIADDDFYILQNLLQFAPWVYYISDNRIKELYKEKLEIMKDYYNGKCDF